MAGGHLLALCAVEGIAEFCAADVADEGFGGGGFDDGVALVFVVAHDAFYSAEVEAGCWEGDDAGGHYLGDGDAEGALLFVVEEGVAVEPDGAVGYAAMAEAFTDGFGDANDDLDSILASFGGVRSNTYHCWEDVCQSSCELEHDDHNGHSDVHDAGESCSSTQESVSTWGDAWPIGITCGKESGLREGLLQILNKDTNHPAKRGTDGHRRYKDARGHFTTVRDDDKECPHHCSNGKRQHHLKPILRSNGISAKVLNGTRVRLTRRSHHSHDRPRIP